MSYKLIIGKIESLSPIEGADRIKKAIVYGNEVVVGLDYKLDQIVCFAPVDGIFEDEFCVKNDLYPIFDDNGKKIGGGFFDRNKPRIRAQKFKSVKSSGFAFPLSFLEYTGYDLSKLKIGDQFDSLNGYKICSKFINEATLRVKSNEARRGKKMPVCNMLLEHKDTEQFRYYVSDIPKGALISLQNKRHGCVDAKTIITTLEYGDIEIEKIIKNRLKCKILAFDIETEEDVWAEIEDFYFYADSDDWYEIELDDGKNIIITGNNPVWMPDYKCYRRVEDLKEGDSLRINS
jgi:hypothetical protein